MYNSLIQITIPPVTLILVMGALSRIGNGGMVARELRRKALHIGIGLTALSFPLFLNTPSKIIAVLGLVIAWFIAIRHNPSLRRRFGTVLHDVRRESLGEIYFALSIGGLLLLTQSQPILFVIPILILTLADAFAAIVGKAFPVGPLAGIAEGKTTAGCATFFLVAFAVSFWCLESIAHLPAEQAYWVATGLALTTCGAEAASRHGVDNLVVPAMAYLILLISDVPHGAGNATLAQFQIDLNSMMAGL